MGKRVCLPSQKAIMAKEAQIMKGMSQRGQNSGQAGGNNADSSRRVAVSGMKSVESKGEEDSLLRTTDLMSMQLRNKAKVTSEVQIEKLQEETNGTVIGTKEQVRKKQAQAMGIWTEIMQSSKGGSQVESSSGKQSWADEVEEEVASKGRQKSIWDDFDIAKLSNAGYKLEYVAPSKDGEEQLVEIELDDIRSEIKFWGNAVVCYVLGAYPPFQVIQGYIQRLWGEGWNR
ncbi:hypothetical protein KY285_005978 [Solanum tuberosum]|nr:hypothetical protein KY289_006469 [Solanum tuberosum]KAH0752830.1 hypothetical protein KY285_005978 [Solanum tuberosum]